MHRIIVKQFRQLHLVVCSHVRARFIEEAVECLRWPSAKGIRGHDVVKWLQGAVKNLDTAVFRREDLWLAKIGSVTVHLSSIRVWCDLLRAA